MNNTVTKGSSINDIIDSLGIKRIGSYTGPGSNPQWEFNGKVISRPSIKGAWRKVKREFGIDSPLLKVDGYITETDNVKEFNQ